MDTQAIRTQITKVVLERLSDSKERRTEALGEFMGVTMPNVEGKAADQVASLVPEIPSAIYQKWVDMFVDRLLETVPLNQLGELCSDTEENRATLSLVYVMFMESERMEKQIVQDLAALGMEQAQQDDVGNTLADYLRAKLANMKGDLPPQ
ncbi:hypothetical protein N1030_02095 [Desulfovibrio mangrovi]|uniref:hypothetical protein n=1 Tax=Desulfovibrio mangrovi TaxID=2976983 RepID=UPI0022454819|nr:hypothetical protein [Desulfovibrio mangrovi]UZP67786.1 hypothetical protein N1030_02095 [Desulfovibrio mangrovi]